MKPLSALPRDEARGLVGLLFDLDDTLLDHGTLTRRAYGALWDLRAAGLTLVAVTGRPSGWGEVLVRQWPVDAAITENGAVVLVREGPGVARLPRGGIPDERQRLVHLVEAARVAVPEAHLSDDAHARATDVTWDIGERHHLPEEVVERLLTLARSHGARTTRSSVHLHASFDPHDKASGTLAFLAGRGEDPALARRRYAFVGDSPNDAACFSAFATTFGVANVTRHLHRLVIPPRYVSPSAMGAGFAEIAQALLDHRA